MDLRARLSSPSSLLLVAVAAAFASLGLAWAAAGPLASGASEEAVLVSLVRSGLWLVLAAWVGTGLAAPPRSRGLLPLSLGLGLGTAAFSGLAHRLAASLGPGASGLMPEPAALAPGWLALLALVALVLAPLAEEWLFRGALYAGIERAHGRGVAAVGSAMAFALFHLAPAQLVAAAVAGLLLAWLRGRSGRLWPCVLAHAVHNAVWLSGALL
jgi:membrane protease YdiL (CAAX protease family)